MDSITTSKERLEYAKVCVEIEVGDVVPETVQFNVCAEASVKNKEIQVWRKKPNLSGIIVKEKIVPASSSSYPKGSNPCFESSGANILQGGVTVELSVVALQESNIVTPLTDAIQGLMKANGVVKLTATENMEEQLVREVIPNATDGAVNLLEGNKEISVGDIPETAVLDQVILNIIDGEFGLLGGNKGISIEDHIDPHVGDFPSLQESILQKKKVRGRKKELVGCSSKLDSLAGGGCCDTRKPQAASMGVVVMLNEIRSKKKDMVEKARGTVKGVGTGINSVPKQGKILKRLESLGVDIFVDGGRLWILWSKRLSFSVIGGCDQALSIKGDISGHSVVITAVYGSNYSQSKKGLWDHLRDLERVIGHSSWVLGGDFNVIADAQESSDYSLMGPHFSADMEEFKDYLEDLEVQDHPFVGPLFTWSNKQDDSYLTRKLDRILTNSQWLLDFPDSYVEFKAPGVSDHCLGLIWTQKEAQVHRPKPFKFFNCWTAIDNFLNIVEESWLAHSDGNEMQILFNKMKRLKPVLKELNRNFFSDISARVAAKMAELEFVQLSILYGSHQFGVEEEKKIHVDLVDLEVAELDFYKQRVKIHWLQEDNMSTKFFHQMVESKKKRNTIRVIRSENGQCFESFDGMAAELVDFYSKLIGAIDPMVQDCPPECLKELLSYDLPAGAERVLDGEFFKVAWEIVHSDFLNAVRYFFQTSYLLPSFNVTAIVLAPKSLNACMAKEFRPISYYSVVYKTITRILVTRLAQFFPEIISVSQSAFVKGRSITDNTLLAQEIIKGYSRRNLSPRCAIKIDLQKAFDSIS
ncbi:uncharacterized protein LOC120159418 [Hibiscus syriacus]|uniref:uncharacterized protein LOC120159418 n=1 Tax=Hibiscus syriacus TaxID=106335 RepID=UPI0019221F0A|nr:uncharacterized protein LOC120159418 [Hibiscus syriacus]